MVFVFSSFATRDLSPFVHIHIEKGEKLAKFWLNPIRLARNYKFSSSELRKLMSMVEERENEIKEKWYDYFESN